MTNKQIETTAKAAPDDFQVLCEQMEAAYKAGQYDQMYELVGLTRAETET